MIFTEKAPSVLDDPESHLSIVDFTGGFPTVFERARQPRDVTPLYAEKLPRLYLLRTGDHSVVDELCDGTRFVKNVSIALGHFRPLAGDGMATGYNDEPNRRTARELLVPAFAMNAVRTYHPSMLTAVNRMIDAWDRAAAEGRPVQVPVDTTRLTLDAIGLTGFGYDFDSFGRPGRHPFATAMLSSMRYLQKQDLRSGWWGHRAVRGRTGSAVPARRPDDRRPPGQRRSVYFGPAGPDAERPRRAAAARREHPQPSAHPADRRA